MFVDKQMTQVSCHLAMFHSSFLLLKDGGSVLGCWEISLLLPWLLKVLLEYRIDDSVYPRDIDDVLADPA